MTGARTRHRLAEAELRVAGLLLAAGAGRRFGRPKATVRRHGVTFVELGIRLLTDGGCAPVVVVAGAAVDEVATVLATTPAADAADLRLVVAENWRSGMAASLQAGLTALAGTDTEAAVVTLVDQPGLGAEAVRRVVTAATVPPAPPDPAEAREMAVVATYGGVPGHPVLLPRMIWAEVAAAARGDVGARAWLRAHPERIRTVACDGTGSPADVDTAADLGWDPA